MPREIHMDTVCCGVMQCVAVCCSVVQCVQKFTQKMCVDTGMADPAPVAFTFNTQAEVGSKFKIDAILCVVDSKHIQQHLDDVRDEGVINEAVNQVHL